jgi:molybdopterin adenylyltransferase
MSGDKGGKGKNGASDLGHGHQHEGGEGRGGPHQHLHSHGEVEHVHAHDHAHAHEHAHGEHAHATGRHEHARGDPAHGDHAHGDQAHEHARGDHAHGDHAHDHAHGEHAHDHARGDHAHEHARGDHAHGDQAHEHARGDHAHDHARGDHAHGDHAHDHARGDHSHERGQRGHEQSHEPHARHEPRQHSHAQPHLDPPKKGPELKVAGQFERADGSVPGAVPSEHKSRAPRWAKVYVITCSDSRTEATDEGGRYLRARLADQGHVLSGHAIVRDEAALITAELDKAAKAGAQAVLLTGGTGLSKRDSTFEAVSAQLLRPIPGFGELFRMLSHQQIGAAAMLSRAVAGVRADGLLVFAMPGSPAAVRLACDQLILPELTHLVEELSR